MFHETMNKEEDFEVWINPNFIKKQYKLITDYEPSDGFATKAAKALETLVKLNILSSFNTILKEVINNPEEKVHE